MESMINRLDITEKKISEIKNKIIAMTQMEIEE